MPNRTFFLDHSSRQSGRSRSLPTEPILKNPKPTRRTQPLKEKRQRADIDETVRLAEQTCMTSRAESIQQRRFWDPHLQRYEKARTRYRQQFYEQIPHSRRNETFEAFFVGPSAGRAPPTKQQVISDLEEGSDLRSPFQTGHLTPMERFLAIVPGDEQSSVDAKARMLAMGLEESDEASANIRIQTAKSLAAELRTTGRKGRGGRSGYKDHGADALEATRQEKSWLELDDSQGSCDSTMRSAQRGSKRKVHRADSSQTT